VSRQQRLTLVSDPSSAELASKQPA